MTRIRSTVLVATATLGVTVTSACGSGHATTRTSAPEPTRAPNAGSSQVTLSGWPLYRYSTDRTVGVAKGQGVGQAWFAVTPQGRKAPAATAPADDPGYGSGY